MDVVTDEQRVADADNPRGYLEFELVKKIKQDASWMADARGKAVKIISQLLFDLPAEEQYQIVFMERDLEEVLTSQEQMLARLGRQAGPREQVRKGFQVHLQRVNEWLGKQPNIKLLRVDYAAVIASPEEQAARCNEFLGGGLDVAAMAEAVRSPALPQPEAGLTPTREFAPMYLRGGLGRRAARTRSFLSTNRAERLPGRPSSRALDTV